jgi:hypothetical protein
VVLAGSGMGKVNAARSSPRCWQTDSAAAQSFSPCGRRAGSAVGDRRHRRGRHGHPTRCGHARKRASAGASARLRPGHQSHRPPRRSGRPRSARPRQAAAGRALLPGQIVYGTVLSASTTFSPSLRPPPSTATRVWVRLCASIPITITGHLRYGCRTRLPTARSPGAGSTQTSQPWGRQQSDEPNTRCADRTATLRRSNRAFGPCVALCCRRWPVPAHPLGHPTYEPARRRHESRRPHG